MFIFALKKLKSEDLICILKKQFRGKGGKGERGTEKRRNGETETEKEKGKGETKKEKEKKNGKG